MHCNFITPPDLIENILIIDATEKQISECADECRTIDTAYDVYFYHAGMDNTEWLSKVLVKADTILQHQDSTVPILKSTRFGPDFELKNPVDYFTK